MKNQSIGQFLNYEKINLSDTGYYTIKYNTDRSFSLFSNNGCIGPYNIKDIIKYIKKYKDFNRGLLIHLIQYYPEYII